ncbi:MAG: hypothetical protein HY000_09040 [Planctomycetes bacterium]|nr:hypothetical protein [Planctomycetota bacterium]
MLRFSLTSLMATVTLAALACVALRFASPLWAGAALMFTLTVLLVAVLGALFRRAEARAFWLGMAVAGGAYLLLIFGPGFGNHVGARLLTTVVLEYARPIVVQTVSPPLQNPFVSKGVGGADVALQHLPKS